MSEAANCKEKWPEKSIEKSIIAETSNTTYVYTCMALPTTVIHLIRHTYILESGGDSLTQAVLHYIVSRRVNRFIDSSYVQCCSDRYVGVVVFCYSSPLSQVWCGSSLAHPTSGAKPRYKSFPFPLLLTTPR